MQTTFSELNSAVFSPIVNIASVRHLSPFRYPGGKTWLVPFAVKHLQSLRRRPRVFVDPFLGGGSVPLAALMEGCVDHAVVCEMDTAVSAVWNVVFSKHYVELCCRILEFDISRERVLDLLASDSTTMIDRAFRAIVRNRTFRGGIMANGAGMVKIGENGRGIASRWYPETLVRRIHTLNALASRVTFIEGDGMKVLDTFAGDPEAFIFVDPPYTAGTGKRAGSRLYDHSQVDHPRIFSTLADGEADFMMTYDDDLEVLSLAKRNGFLLQYLPMKNTHHRCMNELLVMRG